MQVIARATPILPSLEDPAPPGHVVGSLTGQWGTLAGMELRGRKEEQQLRTDMDRLYSFRHVLIFNFNVFAGTCYTA